MMGAITDRDFVQDFCNAVKLPQSACDFVTFALAELGFDPSEIENDLRTEGKDAICEQVAALVGDDAARQNSAKYLCKELISKIYAEVTEDRGGPQAPSSGGKYKIDPAFLRFQAVKRVVNPNRSVAKVGWVVNNGNAVCTASWPGGSRVLPDRDCNNRKLPPGFEKSGFDTTASGAAAIFSSPRTWMIVGSVAVAGIAGWLILKK